MLELWAGVARQLKHRHTRPVDKAFTLRLLRCSLFGLSAFVMILALDITIRSPFDVAGYVLGAGFLWYVVEIVFKPARKQAPPAPPPPPPPVQKKSKPKPKTNPMGEDHFD